MISKISKHFWKEVFCLDILVLLTAGGAAWQDLHFRKVSNRYLAICLGLTILLYIWLEINTAVFTRNLILKSTANQVENMMSDMSPDQLVNKMSDMTLENVADMAVDMAIYIGGGMAVPVLLLWWAFLLRKIGAGDIKLLAVLGAMMGSDRILRCMLWTCLIALMTEGMKCSIDHFDYFFRKAKKEEKRQLPEKKSSESQRPCDKENSSEKSANNVRKRGIPLAVPVFFASVIGICGWY